MLATVEEDGCHYIVMEYVGGGSLADLLDRQSQLPMERALVIALELSDALTRSHHLKVIHRDIKPANILMSEDGTPRLTDFGLAYAEWFPHITEPGQLIGTFQYTSPEACNRQPLDERTDIWSFGVVLYEMLAGERPFERSHPGAVVRAIVSESVPSLARFRDDVPPALNELIQRMLAKNRMTRIASMRLVGAELDVIMRGADRTPPTIQGYP
jgi:serine/threonine-protein kinase